MESFAIKLLTAIIFPLLDRAWDWVDARIKAYQKKKEDEKVAEDGRKKMSDAKTAEEIDNAADDTLSGI